MRIIDPRTGFDAVLAMMQALRRGEILCLMGDRVFGEDPHAVRLPFLGAPAAFPITPYRLASACGVPILVLLTRKLDYRSYEVNLAEVLELPSHLGRDPANYAPWAARFVTALEGFTARYPWAYANFYDLWAERPTAPPPVP